ncbi:MAG TPA: hypothetical protein VNQ33_03775, partial [Acidimicrobiales bacterium]|nr:hypothetical protein [Acidimicrobiales bacterium]
MIRRIVTAGLLTASLLVVAPTPSHAQSAPVASGPRLTLVDQPISVAPDGSFSVVLDVTDAPTATQIAVD